MNYLSLPAAVPFNLRDTPQSTVGSRQNSENHTIAMAHDCTCTDLMTVIIVHAHIVYAVTREFPRDFPSCVVYLYVTMNPARYTCVEP